MLKKIFLILVLVLIAIQFKPVERTNPPVTSDIGAPENVKQILRTSCYDCHSNESIYPWYAYFAPVSWLVEHDILEAREEVNFSEWDKYSNEERAEIIEEIWELIDEGEMPLWYYIPAHPEAKLTGSEKEIIRTWSKINSVND